MSGDYPTSWTCFTCGEHGHIAADCPVQEAPPPKRWVDCSECGRPGHPERQDIDQQGNWFCRDCRDPGWRERLPISDARHRQAGAEVSGHHSKLCFTDGHLHPDRVLVLEKRAEEDVPEPPF